MVDVDFYFDIASPYAFLADLCIDEAIAGLRARVRRIPAYLRGFDAFRDGVPYSPRKVAYVVRDVTRLAERRGVALRAPAAFPINGLYALRALVHAAGTPYEDALRRALFRGAWTDALDVSQPAVVEDIAESVGADRREVEVAIGTDAIKQRLRASTEAAIARGAFGLPAIFVGEELFWGQDRLDLVREEVERRARQ